MVYGRYGSLRGLAPAIPAAFASIAGPRRDDPDAATSRGLRERSMAPVCEVKWRSLRWVAEISGCIVDSREGKQSLGRS
jgi:hypothetical protein